MSAKDLIQKRYQSDNPAVERGMINDNTSLSHHFLQITQAQGISQIPANTQGDNIDGIMQPPEGISDQRHGQVTSKKQHVTR